MVFSGAVVCAILGFLVGLYAGAVTFQSGRMSVAFRYMYAALYEFDRQVRACRCQPRPLCTPLCGARVFV